MGISSSPFLQLLSLTEKAFSDALIFLWHHALTEAKVPTKKN